jgi:hypothetical protein
MNTRLLFVFLFLCALSSGFSEPSDKEIIAVMNKVERGVAAGNASALNDLLTLPPEWAVPAFLTVFKENYLIYGATPTNRAIGEKCAQLATSVPANEEVFAKILNIKMDNGDPSLQQVYAVKCLICAHNKFSVRVLGGALDAPTTSGRAANALATMGLPGAPYASKDKGVASNAKGIAQWKNWWKSNSTNYSGSN